MKKIFTLVLGLMFTVAMFAADRKPMVTVTKARKYEIVIDGRRYFSNDRTIHISDLYYGPHDVKVYKIRPGFFFTARKLVAYSTFRLRNNDIRINIDRFGQLKISESRFGRDWNDQDHGWGNDHDYGNNHDYGNGRDYGNDHDYGNGRNYGKDHDYGNDRDYGRGNGNHDRRF